MISNIVNWRSGMWALLVALTLFSVTLVEVGLSPASSVLIIAVIAAVKSRFVILHYMEAKHAAKHWRFLYGSWNYAAAATIVIGHYMTH